MNKYERKLKDMPRMKKENKSVQSQSPSGMVMAPEGQYLPCVEHCIYRIASRWSSTIKDEALYDKMSKMLASRVAGIPQLHTFTRADDSIIENVARQIEIENHL